MPSRRDFIKGAAFTALASSIPFSLSALAKAVRDVHFLPSAGQVGAF